MGLFGFLGRAAKGFLTGGPAGVVSVVAAPVLSRLGGGGPQPTFESERIRLLTARDKATGSRAAGFQRQLNLLGGGEVGIPGGGGFFGGRGLAPGAPCDFPKVIDRDTGFCRTPTSGEFGGEQFGVGEAVMGRYGAGLEPGSKIVDRAVCLPGMVLGNDGICYNRSQIANKMRMWPKGRKPLLTGGELNAITTASRAARRIKNTTKRLERLGMLEKPRTRRPVSKQHVLPQHHH